jgi:succinoglycan biosynthesis protein ExoO
LPGEHEVSRDEERHLLSAFDVIVAIQDQERKVFERMLPQQTVVTVGHAVDIAPQPCTSQDVCFVGSKSPVNAASLLAFVEHAWPKIRAAVPAARLQIVGGVGKVDDVVKAAKRDRRIVSRGVVPNVGEIYAGPAVMICPLWVGSGLKIKMVEALAHGKAIVASPVAAQGLEDGIDDAFCLAARPEDFAQPVVSLLHDSALRQRFEQGAIDYAREQFSESRVWRPMDEILSAGLAPRQLAFAA